MDTKPQCIKMRYLFLLLFLLFSCQTEPVENKDLIKSIQESNEYLEEYFSSKLRFVQIGLEKVNLNEISNDIKKLEATLKRFEDDLALNLSDSLSVLQLENNVKTNIGSKLYLERMPSLKARLKNYHTNNKRNALDLEVAQKEYCKYKIDLIQAITSSMSICPMKYEPELAIQFLSRKVKAGDTLKAAANLKMVDVYLNNKITKIEIDSPRKHIETHKNKILIGNLEEGIHTLKGRVLYEDLTGKEMATEFIEYYMVE